MSINALVALGANQPSVVGEPQDTLMAALDALGDSGLILGEASRFFATPCFPVGAGPNYVNSTVSVSGVTDPREILQILHQVEAEFGRDRAERWGQRVLDLDLLAFGDLVLPDIQTHSRWRALAPEDQRSIAPDELILPHPRMQDRAFVLVPLAEIALNWMHPVLHLSVKDMLAALPETEKSAVTPL